MSEPQHPTPFGSHTGSQSGGQPDGEALAGRDGVERKSGGELGIDRGGRRAPRAAASRRKAGRSTTYRRDSRFRRKKCARSKRATSAICPTARSRRASCAATRKCSARIRRRSRRRCAARGGAIEQNLTVAGVGGRRVAARTRVGAARQFVGPHAVRGCGASRRSSSRWSALVMWHTGGDSADWLARLKASATGTAVVDVAIAVERVGGASSVATPDEAAAANTGEASLPEVAAARRRAADAASARHERAAGFVVGVVGGAGRERAGCRGACIGCEDRAGCGGTASAPAVAGSGSSALELKVKEDSWFSVRGRTARKYSRSRARRAARQRVEGEAPFKVTIGNRAGHRIAVRSTTNPSIPPSAMRPHAETSRASRCLESARSIAYR